MSYKLTQEIAEKVFTGAETRGSFNYMDYTAEYDKSKKTYRVMHSKKLLAILRPQNDSSYVIPMRNVSLPPEDLYNLISVFSDITGFDVYPTSDCDVWDWMRYLTKKDFKNLLKSHLILVPEENSSHCVPVYHIPVNDGYLEVLLSADEDYPGVDIEYVQNKEKHGTRPRVVIETPQGESVRALIWNDPAQEDYTWEFNFE